MTLKEELLECLQENGISPEQIALVDECFDKDELDEFKGSFVTIVGWAEFDKKVSKDYNEFGEAFYFFKFQEDKVDGWF